MPVRVLVAVPQLTVNDVQQTAEYYRDVFGFTIASYWDGEQVVAVPEKPPVFGIVHRDGVEIFLSRADRPGGHVRRSEFAYDVYLRVSGIDDLASELRSGGAEIVSGPEDRVYGAREIVAMDCNGFVIAFGEDTGAGVSGA